MKQNFGSKELEELINFGSKLSLVAKKFGVQKNNQVHHNFGPNKIGTHVFFGPNKLMGHNSLVKILSVTAEI